MKIHKEGKVQDFVKEPSKLTTTNTMLSLFVLKPANLFYNFISLHQFVMSVYVVNSTEQYEEISHSRESHCFIDWRALMLVLTPSPSSVHYTFCQ